MCGCNRTVVFNYEKFEGKGFEDMPKGEFARVAVNPYNGKIVLTFNDRERYAEVIEDVISQINAEIRRMRFASGGAAGLREFADVCDGIAGKADYEPSVVRMVEEGVYTQRAYLGMVG